MKIETLREGLKLNTDITLIEDVLQEIERTNVISKDLILTLDTDTYKLVLDMIKETLRDTLKYKEKKLEEL